MMLDTAAWLAELRDARKNRASAAAMRIDALLRWLAVITTVGMCFVLQQGTLVTNSGSAAGCGNTWPLCRGQIVPELSGVGSAATLIEFTHRAAVPVESVLIILLSTGILWFWWGRTEPYILAPAMIFFLFLQAVLGALAVAYPTSAGVLAAHFGISLMAFASVVLAAAFVLEIGKAEVLRDVPIGGGLRWAIRGILVYTYAVVYLGAYVRHAGASLSCLDWPLCNGRVIPRFIGGEGTQFLHRVSAGVLVLLLLGLYLAVRRVRNQRPDLYRASIAGVVLVFMQAISGAIVVETRIAVLSTLLHAFLISLLFSVLAYMWFHTLRRPAIARQAAKTPELVAAPRMHGAQRA
jgi:cytochrome c oxidase assembly protein subunit 15